MMQQLHRSSAPAATEAAAAGIHLLPELRTGQQSSAWCWVVFPRLQTASADYVSRSGVLLATQAAGWGISIAPAYI
jgi:uncharacterized protein (DUF1810 family)